MAGLLNMSFDDILIGNSAGWRLSFHQESVEGTALKVDPDPALDIGTDAYEAKIQATLPKGLEGGTYSFTIRGLSDKHYQQIAPDNENAPKALKLYLYWRDVNDGVLGYLQNLAGLTETLGAPTASDLKDWLVAVLRIVSVTRKAGKTTYDTTITAREWVFDVLEERRLRADIHSNDPKLALDTALATDGGLVKDDQYKIYDITPNPDCAPPPPAKTDKSKERYRSDKGKTVVECLRIFSKQLEEETGRHGRGMYLIRDGLLYVGPRLIPLDKEKSELKKLYLRNGLITMDRLEDVVTDTNFDFVDKPDETPPTAKQFRLTLKGRPDLKPGDLVAFEPQPSDVSTTIPSTPLGAFGDFFGSIAPELGGGVGDKAVTAYVNSVKHSLSRTSGFATELTCVEILGGATGLKLWHCHTALDSGSERDSRERSADPADEAAKAIKRAARREVERNSFPQIAEVRAVVSGETDDAQTLTLWQGLEPGRGRGNKARRVPIDRERPTAAGGVSYLTPFAWGKCGLVLPNYPFERVMVSYRGGNSNEPVVVGALWEEGNVPDAKPGDWWLILPAAVAEKERSTVAEDAKPASYAGTVTNDLIDADGNRVIEAGSIFVRIGKLRNAGARPELPGDADSVSIEHADAGSKIVMKSDGTVVIHAAGDLEIKSENGDVKIDAKNVMISVSQGGSVDIS